MQIRGIFIIIVMALSFFSACESSPQNTDKPLTGAAIRISEGETHRENGKQIRIFEVEVSQDGFSPMNLEAKRGELIRINLLAKDTDHNFILNDFDVAERIPKGKTVQVEFVAETKGIHNFHSSQFTGNTPARGQLIVTLQS